ncbi:hypothetical protein KKE45_00480 [Patescibacteria group bacterium]|nr:hypothetical protein [Patescibacteria group bacterium]
MKLSKQILNSITRFGAYWQKKTNRKILRWNILFILIQLILLVYELNNLPPQVPFFYGLPWGSAQLAPASYLFLLPIFSFLVLLLNSFLATIFDLNSILLSYLLNISSLLFSLLALTTLLRIIILVA